MQASGVWQCRVEPTHSKQLAAARAAQSGVIAADLAKLGLAGPRQILEGTHGFFAAACPGAAPERAAADADAPWKMLETSFKPWPACRHAHPVIEAALGVRHGLDAGAVAGIDIFTYREAVEFCDKPTPESADEARFSLQHCAAVALVKGGAGACRFRGGRVGRRGGRGAARQGRRRRGCPSHQGFPGALRRPPRGASRRRHAPPGQRRHRQGRPREPP